MTIDDFSNKVKLAVQDRIADGEVEIRNVVKNNGLILHGLMIHKSTGNIVPTVYLEQFLDQYNRGEPFSNVIENLMDLYSQCIPVHHVDMSYFREYENVKNKICYRLIHKEQNEKLLEDIPYVEFFDLIICFFYAYSDPHLGEGSILIHNSHMENWGIQCKDLMQQAMHNTPKLFPVYFENIITTLENTLYSLPEGYDLDVPMYVLSNQQKTYGASVILYEGCLKEIANKLQSNLYIIPSSVHEVIILKAEEGDSCQCLKPMIAEVNATVLTKEEYLSDSLYFYDFLDDRIARI